MSRFEISYAERKDEADLRRLLRENPFEGKIEMLFTREDDYFRSIQVQGNDVRTLCLRDHETQNLAGLATIAIRKAFVNGSESKIGYLGNLRIASKYRNSTFLAHGYKFFKQNRWDYDVKLYVSTIIEDNILARNILESGRCGLPSYRDIGRYSVLIMNPGAEKKHLSQDLQVRKALKTDIPLIIQFLNKEGAKKQFFPVYTQLDLSNYDGLLYGLQINDIFLAFSGDRIVGTAAVWDQSKYKQNIVAGYNNHLRYTRWLVNAAGKVFGYPTYPAPGQNLNYSSLALVCINENDPDIFETLIDSAKKRCSRNGRLLLAGFHEKDPLLEILKQQKHVIYSSRMYIVHWKDGQEEHERLDDCVPYLELGAL